MNMANKGPSVATARDNQGMSLVLFFIFFSHYIASRLTRVTYELLQLYTIIIIIKGQQHIRVFC